MWNNDSMISTPSHRASYLLTLLLPLLLSVQSPAQTPGTKRAFMITDMEGVTGIFDTELQCLPYKRPRWKESRKLRAGEIIAALIGHFEAGASEVGVWIGRSSGQNRYCSD